MKRPQITGQVSFDELFREDPPPARLSLEQEVYLVDLDIVQTGTVNSMWLLRDTTEYGYCIKMRAGLFSTTWDSQYGTRCFTSEEEAKKLADIRRPYLIKIDPNNELEMSERRSFVHPGAGSNSLYATFAKIGDDKLLWKSFVTYTFFETFPNQKKRDAAYKTYVKEAEAEIDRQNGNESEHRQLPQLYWATDTQYASWEYAMRNGQPFIEQYYQRLATPEIEKDDDFEWG